MKEHPKIEIETTVPLIYLNLVDAEVLKQIRSGEMNLTKLMKHVESHPKAHEIYEWTLRIRKRVCKSEWGFDGFVADASERIYLWARGKK